MHLNWLWILVQKSMCLWNENGIYVTEEQFYPINQPIIQLILVHVAPPFFPFLFFAHNYGMHPHQGLFCLINWEKQKPTTSVLWFRCKWHNPQPKTVSWNCLSILKSRRNHRLHLHIWPLMFSQSQLSNSSSLKVILFTLACNHLKKKNKSDRAKK